MHGISYVNWKFVIRVALRFLERWSKDREATCSGTIQLGWKICRSCCNHCEMVLTEERSVMEIIIVGICMFAGSARSGT